MTTRLVNIFTVLALLIFLGASATGGHICQAPTQMQNTRQELQDDLSRSLRGVFARHRKFASAT